MEIKMVHCPNGHYYNAALHSVCPECGMSAVSGSAAGGAGNFAKTEAPGAAPSGGAGSFGKTEIPGGGATGNFGRTEAPGAGGTGNFGKTEDPYSSNSGAGYNNYSAGPTIPGDVPRYGDPEPFGTTEIGGDLASGSQVEPVVGWLVCVEGPVRGTDYRIHSGYNYIGREIGDIHVHGDMQISRQNHAMVAFDPAERIYYVGPAAGRNLIKVNGKIVINAQEIHNYDVISLGTSKFLFVALCGKHFGWDTGLTNG